MNMDYFIRSSDARGDVAVCICDGEARGILDSGENDSSVPGENIVYLLSNGQDAGVSALVTTGDLLNLYTDKTSDMFMPVIKMNENEKNAVAAGIGLFSGDRLVHITSDEETMGFLFISNKAKNCNLEFETDEFGKVGVELRDIKTKKQRGA